MRRRTRLSLFGGSATRPAGLMPLRRVNDPLWDKRLVHLARLVGCEGVKLVVWTFPSAAVVGAAVVIVLWLGVS